MKGECCKVASMVNLFEERSDPVGLIFISHVSSPYENHGQIRGGATLAIHEGYFHISEM
jgi:hypothetical protein